MAQSLQMRRSVTLTVGTTVTQILGVEAAREVVIWETSTKLFLIHTTLEDLVVDGGAVPAIDARPIPSGTTLGGFSLPPRTFLGIAGVGAGTVTIEFADD